MEDRELIEKILALNEGQHLEFKQILKKPKDVLPTICAFANNDGGTFIYGLEDPKKCSGRKRLKGISSAKDNCDELIKHIANNFVPPLSPIEINYFDIVNTQNQEDQILCININASKTVHSLNNGHTYLRRGSQNNLLTHEQSMQLQYEKGCITFESELVKNITLEDLDNKMVEIFKDFNESNEKDTLRFFVKNGLSEKKDGKIYLNNAVAFLFAPNPSISLKRKCLHPQISILVKV